MKSHFHCALMFAGLIALGACATPPSAPVPVADGDPATAKLEIVSREELHPLPPDTQRLVLINLHGDIRIRMSQPGQVGVHATIQRIGETPLDPTITTRNADGAFILEVRYPGDTPGSAPANHRLGRTDLALFVPPSLPLAVRTGDGLLQVRRAPSAVNARSQSGSIEVSGFADLDLHSVSGRVTGAQLSGEWSKPVRFVSEQGTVLASVPAFADVRLSVSAGGAIDVPHDWGGESTAAAEGTQFERNFGTGSKLMQIRAGSEVLLVPVIPDSALQPPNQGAQQD